MKSTKSKLALFSFAMLIVVCLFNYTSHTTWAADVKTLVKEAKEFLQKEEDALAAKGKVAGKVVAVVVTGPWRIFKKNLLGEPIQYNLPITTTVQIESEKKSNRIRVYHSTMLTQEMKGVKKAPPFLGATVGDSYYVRPSAVK